MGGARYRFGGYELDAADGELVCHGSPVDIEPTPLRLLAYLAGSRDRIVPYEELLRTLWSGVSVSPRVLSEAVRKARAAVGDSGSDQEIVRTRRGIGYQFVAEVEEIGDECESFVGRRSILDRLEDSIAQARNGVGSVIQLKGEPGIGKSRTAQEAARIAERSGFAVALGACHEVGAAPAFWPWIQMLNRLRDEVDPEMGLQSISGERDGSLYAALGYDEARQPGREQRFALFVEVARTLDQWARQRPLLLILEDAHWADGASLRLLEFVAGEITSVPICVVVTIRTTEIEEDHPVRETMARLTRLHPRGGMQLPGLSAEEVSEWIEGRAELPPDTERSARLYELSGGNPLLLQETLRLEADGWSSASLPTGLRAMIRMRLDRLGKSAQLLLQAGSVVGREFAFAPVAKVAGLRDEIAHDAVEEAKQAGLIEGHGPYRFIHALIRDALYQGLTADVRAELHRGLAQFLEQVGRNTGAIDIAQLAHHYLEVGGSESLERGLHYSIEAGYAANADLAYEEAARYFDRALELLDAGVESSEDVEATALSMVRADAWYHAGEIGQSRTAYLDTMRRAKTRGDALAFGRAALGHASWTFTSDIDREQLRLIDEALDLLPEEEKSLRASLLSRMAECSQWGAVDPGRMTIADSAVALARESGDRDAVHLALSCWLFAEPPTPDFRTAAAYADEMIEIANAERDDYRVIGGHAWRGMIRLRQGDLFGFEQDLNIYCPLAARMRHPFYDWNRHVNRGALALARGEFERAEELAFHSLEQGGNGRIHDAETVFGAQLYSIRNLQGRIAELEEVFRDAARKLPNNPLFQGMLTYLLTRAGKIEEAARLLAAASSAGLDRLPRDSTWSVHVYLLSLACESCEAHEAARVLYGELLPFSEQCLVAGFGCTIAGSAHLPLGVLASTCGEKSLALWHLEKARVTNERSGIPVYGTEISRAKAAAMGLCEDSGRLDEFRPARAIAMAASGG